MKQCAACIACAAWLLFAGPLRGDPWDTVVLRDDFDAGVGAAKAPDPSVWVVNHPESAWWVQGRTFFPSPVHHPAGPFPYVENGACIIGHHLYNPYDLAPTPWTFLGGEIHTVMEFDPATAYRFEAAVRCHACPNGLVTSFFTYGYDGALSDEIDFEFLSNKINDDATYPGGDPALTNPWNESDEKPALVVPAGLDLTAWNTFRITWYPGERVTWTWLDPGGGEVLLRSETEAVAVPDEPMALYFNFWAPTSSWTEAYDASLQPATEPGENQVCLYEIDYVEVRVPEPGTGTLLLIASPWLLAVVRVRRRRPGVGLTRLQQGG